MAKRGNPTKYTRALADEICRRVASGESLLAISKRAGLPPESTIRQWALDDRDGFAAKYARARDIRGDHYGDKVIDILSTKPRRIVTTKADGTTEEKDDPAHVAWLKNLADGVKWTASKLKPKTWGDKLDVEHFGSIDIGARLDAARKRARGES
jgi:hypothetical protein